MKQHKRASKRKPSRRVRPLGQRDNSHPSQGTINQDEVMNQVENIVNALVDASHGEFVADAQSEEFQDWENDEGWLEHLKRSVEHLEQRLGALDAISPGELHDSWRRQHEESPVDGDFPVERYLDYFLLSLRDKFRKSLFIARIERDAQQLKMAVREEVTSLCARGSFQAHDFIKIPPALPEGEIPNLSESERAEIIDTFCRSIWWMMADHYPKNCTVHFYLECHEGWFSAEVYADEEEAGREAEKRRHKGEGDFEIREISDGDDWVVFTVLFSKERPKFR
jgi:hypothetical protein